MVHPTSSERSRTLSSVFELSRCKLVFVKWALRSTLETIEKVSSVEVSCFVVRAGGEYGTAANKARMFGHR